MDCTNDVLDFINELVSKAYDEGYEDGKVDGYDEGHAMGYDEGIEASE